MSSMPCSWVKCHASISTATSPATVTAQTGVTMDVLLQDLENAGLGVTACPAPGDITLGGALAIDGHGTAIPATGEYALQVAGQLNHRAHQRIQTLRLVLALGHR